MIHLGVASLQDCMKNNQIDHQDLSQCLNSFRHYEVNGQFEKIRRRVEMDKQRLDATEPNGKE
jgi:hypothetical protein